MTNCNATGDVERLLEDLLERLDEEHMHRAVDTCIEAAAREFPIEEEGPFTQARFLEVLGGFVRHVYAHRLRLIQVLTPLQAQAEALSLLERHYRGTHGDGYHAALLDAADPARSGLAAVVSELTAIVRTVERWKYVEWVLCSAVDPRDWHTQCALARLLLERFAQYWPSALLRYPAHHLAGDWRLLILVHLNTSAALHGIVSGPRFTT